MTLGTCMGRRPLVIPRPAINQALEAWRVYRVPAEIRWVRNLVTSPLVPLALVALQILPDEDIQIIKAGCKA